MTNNKISINDLPSYSPWPARLLGLEKYEQKTKNIRELEREYEKEKWNPILKKLTKLRGNHFLLHEVDKIFEGNQEGVYFKNNKFRLSEREKIHQYYKKLIFSEIKPYIDAASSITELGSGYGAIIIDIAKRIKNKKIKIMALEFAESGMKLSKKIALAEKLDIVSGKCDITKSPFTNVKIPSDGIIFTSYVTSLITKTDEKFVRDVIKLKPKVVIHFEPFYEHCDNSLFGLMRKRYIELNGYNKNYLSIIKKLEKNEELKIIKNEPVLFGSNPFFCSSLLIWKPKNKIN